MGLETPWGTDRDHGHGCTIRTERQRFHASISRRAGDDTQQWLFVQRLAHAQRLLETTDEPVERVPEHAGFGTALSLRQHSKRQNHTSLLAYRRASRGPGRR